MLFDQNYLTRKVTIFDNVKDRNGRNSTLAEFLKMGEARRQDIERVRAAADEVERAKGEGSIQAAKGKLRALKEQLPCCTVSGTFSGGRRAGDLLDYSGLVCIDIDHCDPSAVMKQLEEWDIIAFASRSASGRGVFAIVPVADPNRHKEQFLALEFLFKEMGITIDPATKDITRLRFLSYDSEAFYRPDAVEFAGYMRPSNQTSQERPKAKDIAVTDYDRERAAACVREIERRHIDIAPDNESWHKMAFALSTLGEDGRELFKIVAEQCGDPNRKATPRENDREFNRGLRENRGITLATFFAACNKNGVNGRQLLQSEDLTQMAAAVQQRP